MSKWRVKDGGGGSTHTVNKNKSRVEIQSPLVNSVPLVHYWLYRGVDTQPYNPTSILWFTSERNC